MILKIAEHFLLGLLFAATGFLVRGTCNHRGWLPHPRQQVVLTAFLVFVEAFLTVPIVG